MLIYTMNCDEMKREIRKDLPFIRHQIISGIKIAKKEYKKKTFCTDYKMIMPFVTNNKNKGYILFVSNNLVKHCYHLFFTITTNNGNKLISVFIKDETFEIVCLNVFSAHFFDRYNERLHLNLSNKKVIEHFIYNNNCPLGKELRENQLVVIFSNGIGLGCYDNKDAYFNTFISNEMTKGKQTDLYNEIKEFKKIYNIE